MKQAVLKCVAITSASYALSLIIIGQSVSQEKIHVTSTAEVAAIVDDYSAGSEANETEIVQETGAMTKRIHQIQMAASIDPQTLHKSWHQYHRRILPVAVSLFLFSFCLWSLTSVENLALRLQNRTSGRAE